MRSGAIMNTFRLHLSFSLFGMRISAVLSLLASYLFIGTAHAMSCMPHESEGKASLCYHKSADGRCLHFGPACQTKIQHPEKNKPIKPFDAQTVADAVKK